MTACSLLPWDTRSGAYLSSTARCRSTDLQRLMTDCRRYAPARARPGPAPPGPGPRPPGGASRPSRPARHVSRAAARAAAAGPGRGGRRGPAAAGRGQAPQAEDLPRYLQRVEGVAGRCPVDAHQHRTWERGAELLPEHLVDAGHAERAHRDAGQFLAVQRRLDGGERAGPPPRRILVRTAASSRARPPASRRSANASDLAEAGSSHCASLTASSSGAPRASSPSRASTPVPTARGSRSPSPASSRSSATCSGRRCGAGSSAKVSAGPGRSGGYLDAGRLSMRSGWPGAGGDRRCRRMSHAAIRPKIRTRSRMAARIR